jgi:UDP-N-acetylglucosamine 2-epimerase
MKVVSIVGARPQFIKASPLSRELRLRHHEILVHTGQHYDRDMSDVFFEELGMPVPDYHLGIGSGPHGAQTGAMLAAIETVLQKESPDAVIVYGDTNSTLAGALAAAKLHLPVAHVEAGLRSFNRRMPEEINRVVTDHLSAWLLAPSEVSRQQLAQEGIVQGVHVVGDIMVDALHLHGPRAAERSEALARHQLRAGTYYLATVHRAENTDEGGNLRQIFDALGALDRPVILPLHPRTEKRMAELGVAIGANVRVLAPQGYLDMLALQRGAACVLTDSGGIQKEAYYLRVPCVTLRTETEWVETVATGWNTLVGTDPERILAAVARRPAPGTPHPDLYGDGMTAGRIVEILSAEPTRS